MRRAVLIHWHPDEGAARLSALEAAGWQAECYSTPGANIKPLRENVPQMFVIDLTRLPSHGIAMASVLRQFKQTRHVPIVFAGGLPAKVAKVRESVPDAVFTEWDEIAAAMTEALRTAPDEPVRPVTPANIGYSKTPLAKKLGIREGSALTLLGAPQGFASRIGLPDGVEVHHKPASAHRVILFVRTLAELRQGFPKATKCVAEKGGLWIAWPKKSSGIPTDFNETTVREIGMTSGWVDYKVCAIDDTWSGLLFAPQRKIGHKLE